jgi:hypothetical protein
MSIFWELWQQHRMEQNRADAISAASSARHGVSEVERRITARLDSIVLADAALWALLKDKLGLTDQHLIEKMEEIDIADGVRDGKAGPAMHTCPRCHRRSAEHRNMCLYCGERLGN